MIEIIQQTEKKKEKSEGRLPNNIRQIGNPEKDFRIYMEDYVYTYLHPAQIQGMEIVIVPRLLILLGEINHFADRSCAFISGAVLVENDGKTEGLPELNDRTWREIHREIGQFFEKCEIVGWVLDIPGNTLAVTKEMEIVHRKNFVSPYQFFFLMDSKEREEAFYTWKEGQLTRKEGYFIYYEKNPQMQEYMISKREAMYGKEPVIEQVSDEAARNYRAMMLKKKEHTYKRGMGFLSYLTSILMVVVLSSVSVVLISYIHRMDSMERAISTMSEGIDVTEEEKENEKNQVAVEAISGNVYPVDESHSEKQSDAQGEEQSSNTDTQSQNEDTTAQGQSEETNMAGTEQIKQSGNADASQPENGNTTARTQPENTEMTGTDGVRQSQENNTVGQAGSADISTQTGDTNATASAETSNAATQAGSTDTASASGSSEVSTQTGNTDAESAVAAPQTSAGGNDTASTQTDAAAQSEAAQTYRKQGYYIVQAGDSLRQISYSVYQTYTMVDAICKANHITDQDAIMAGQKLILP